MAYDDSMTTAGYTIETTTSTIRGMSLASAAGRLRQHKAEGRFAMVSRDSDGTTLTGCHGFYLPPYVAPPALTDAERAAL
jgi:hypothetical protein